MQDSSYKEVTILLVEDDDVDAMGVIRQLKRNRLANNLVRARDGIEALKLLRDGIADTPFLILLDLNMPRMSGLEMLRELRSDPELTSAIVFVLTTSKDDEDKASAYKEHIAGYIVKSSLDNGFENLFSMLDHYWRIVEFPKFK